MADTVLPSSVQFDPGWPVPCAQTVSVLDNGILQHIRHQVTHHGRRINAFSGKSRTGKPRAGRKHLIERSEASLTKVVTDHHAPFDNGQRRPTPPANRFPFKHTRPPSPDRPWSRSIHVFFSCRFISSCPLQRPATSLSHQSFSGSQEAFRTRRRASRPVIQQ